MVEEALAAYERGAELYPADMGLKGELAVAYGVAGRKDQAQSILDELEERAQRGRVSPHAMALAQLGVGNKDEAMRWLEKVYEERSPSLIFMNENPRYDGLRGDPRFQELLRKVGFEELKVLPGAESD